MSTGDSLWDRWPEVDRLFSAALERQPPERDAFLDAAAAGDRELIEAVQRLLQAEVASQRFPEQAGKAATRLALDELATRADQPSTIGRYAVLRELGRGGMGTVYLGELQGNGFRQLVAIKVLRRGVDTDDMLRRFLTERRILASLNHPNIARLFDGGATSDGRPFLVMEYVEGEPITAYCDRNRCSVRQRLEFFLDVCRAVMAAHASLVVHRDLKPSNILVTPAAQVTLLDFGIAKLIDPQEGTEHTQTGTHLLTPEHASPEQLLGERITTATDIYQLGVLLFQLLTGERPQRVGVHSLPALQAAANGTEPPWPSRALAAGDLAFAAHARTATPAQLRRALKGDLDTIVRKALQPQPDRRYPSVEQLAHDVERFIQGRTISARPDDVLYRTRMFLRRHPWLPPVAVTAVLVMMLYVGTTVRHAGQLQAERNAATLQAERAQEVQRFLVDLFRSADPYAPADLERGRQITVVEALDVGVERLTTSLRDRPVVRAAILAAIAEVYQNLGAIDRARPLHDEALALQERWHGERSREVRDSLGHLAKLRTHDGDFDAALALHERRLSLARAAPADAAELAKIRVALALHLIGRSRQSDAEPHLQAVIAAATDAGLEAADAAEAYRAMSDVHRFLGRHQQAEQSAREAVNRYEQALGKQSVGAALSHVSLGQALGALDRVAEADAHFAAALPILERSLGPEHGLSLVALNNLAVLRQTSGNLSGAEAILRRLLGLVRRVHGERHHLVADSLQNLATVLTQQGASDEALDVYREASDIYRETLEPDDYRRGLPSLSLSGLHLTRGSFREAEDAARHALGILSAALPEGHYATAVAQCRLARALVGRDSPHQAEPLFARSAGALLSTPRATAYRAECLNAAASFYEAQGHSEEAAAFRAALSQPVQ